MWLTIYLLRLSSSGWIPVMDTVAEFEQPGEVQPTQENEYKVDGVSVKSGRFRWLDPSQILGGGVDMKYNMTRSYAMYQRKTNRLQLWAPPLHSRNKPDQWEVQWIIVNYKKGLRPTLLPNAVTTTIMFFFYKPQHVREGCKKISTFNGPGPPPP